MALLNNLKSTTDKIRPYQPAMFFAAGFLFDLITLKRIDHWVTITQQGVFLTLCGLILYLTAKSFQPEPTKKNWLVKVWSYNTQILHFLFGSLLSAYTIFYFKSASFFTSFSFFALIFALLILNESKKVRSLGISFKFSLFVLCLLSYFAYLVPTLIGSVGWLAFLLSWTLTLGICWLFFKKLGGRLTNLTEPLWLSTTGVLATFFILYAVKVLPPVPLSIQHIGVYHKIEKVDDTYKLYHEKPLWKFWHSGDQSFKAQTGDEIYVFARLFSPTRFEDKVHFQWFSKNHLGDWDPMDDVAIRIVGGRSEGFRGFTKKSVYRPGEWKVKVLTSDQREIGRIYFKVAEVEVTERSFVYDSH